MAAYSLYSMERPGRPALAAVLSAAMLVATVALAWGLVRYRQASIEVALGEAQGVANWPLVVRVPSGWQAVASDRAREGIGLIVQEPGGRKRRLAFVRGPVLSSPGLMAEAAEAMGAAVGRLVETELVQPVSYGFARVGPLAGAEGRWQTRNAAGEVREVAGIFTRTPQGRVYGMLLDAADGIERSDDRFLRHVAAAVDLPGLGIIRNVPEAARSCGLRFDPPDGSFATVSGDRPVRSLHLFSAADAVPPWSLEVRPIPLAPGRTPKEVLADIVRNLRDTAEPTTTLQTVSLGGRETYCEKIEGTNGAWGIHLWLVPVGNGTAVLLAGVIEGSVAPLAAVCEKVAGSIALEGAAGPVDVAAAQQRAVDLLVQVRERGLGGWFKAWPDEPLLFLIWRDEEIMGYSRFTRTRLDDAGSGAAWRIEIEQRYRLPRGRNALFRSVARVDDAGVTYSLAASRQRWTSGAFGAAEPASLEQYQEERRAGEDVVRRTLEIDRNVFSRKLAVGGDFVGDPAVELFYWLASGDARRRPFLVTTVGWLEPGLISQLVVPLGVRPVPGFATDVERPAVLIRTDSQTDSRTFYFDEDGRPLVIDFDGSVRMVRTTEEELRQKMPASDRKPDAPPLRGGGDW